MYRIMYKLCTLAHKIINGCAPPYLADFVTPKIIHRTNLRSENDYFIMQPLPPSNDISYKMTYSWNDLPYSIRCLSSIDQFKKDLKTHYFKIAYG